MSEKPLERGFPARVALGFGGLAQLVAVASTKFPPIQAEPTLQAALSGGLACTVFLACGFAAQRGVRGSARVVWSVYGSYWAGFGFWLVSVPFSITAPLPVQEAALPFLAFVYRFPLTYRGFDVARDLAAVLFLSLGCGLLAGAAGVLVESLSESSETGPTAKDDDTHE